MQLESNKFLFILNPESSPIECYSFIKENLFDIFKNIHDWTFVINFKLSSNIKKRILLFSLKGSDLSLELISANFIILIFNNTERIDTKIIPLKNNEYFFEQVNTIELCFILSENAYVIKLNNEILSKIKLKNIFNRDTKKIEYCIICKQDSKESETLCELDIKNILFSNSLISISQISYLFKEETNEIYKDHYGRNLISNEIKKNIVAFYNFKDNLDNKIWDLSGNNNFMFIGLNQENISEL